jgi:hypothetical protein
MSLDVGATTRDGGEIGYDGVFEYVDTWGALARCDLVVATYQNGDTLVLYTERGDNAGKSVHNDAEHLASVIVNFLNLDPARTDFVARFTVDSYEPPMTLPPLDEQYPNYTVHAFQWDDKTAGAVEHRPVRAPLLLERVGMIANG